MCITSIKITQIIILVGKHPVLALYIRLIHPEKNEALRRFHIIIVSQDKAK